MTSIWGRATIVDAQRVDGGWAWELPGRRGSHPHPTGFAAISLWFWLEGDAAPLFYPIRPVPPTASAPRPGRR